MSRIVASGKRFAVSPSFLTVCLNPTLQKTFLLSELRPSEVNRARDHRLDVAGKGVNVSRVLRQAGQTEIHLTHAGGRDLELFRSLCRADLLDPVIVECDVEVRYAYTLLDSSSRSTTEIVEEAVPAPPGVEMEIRAAFEELLPHVDVVIISGSKAPGFTPALFPELTRAARAAKKLVVLDYRGEDLINSLPEQPDIIKPNLAEFVSSFLPELGTISEHADDRRLIEAVKKRMLEIYREVGSIPVITRGKHSTLYVDEGEVHERAVPAVEVVNTIGSGDAFAAGLAISLHDGASLSVAVDRGHELAGANAARLRPGVIR